MVRCLAAVLIVVSLGCADVRKGRGDAGTAKDSGLDAPAADVAGGGGGGSGGQTTTFEVGPPGERVIGSAPLGDAACATQTQQAEKLPLDMYIMLDSSASMDELTTSGQPKWNAVRAALIAFINDQQSAGLGVGLQYFPLIHAGVPPECTIAADCGQHGPCKEPKACSGGTTVRLCEAAAECGGNQTCDLLGVCSVSGVICSPAGPGFFCPGINGRCLPFIPYCEQRDVCEPAPYAMPAVAVAALPGAAPALIASLNAHMTDGFTPTAGALAGGIAHARALATASPGRRVVLVLATDGLPSECTPTDIAGIGAIAAAGRMGATPVSTFVIGVFAAAEQPVAEPNLNLLAQSGGTGQAFIINTGQNVTQAFQAALNSVRTAALACDYAIPSPGATGDGGSGMLDYYSVNVQFKPGSGPAVTIGNVPDRARCHPTLGGWFYDVNPVSGMTPRTISVCETTCSQFRADPAGKVDILLGCKTEVIVL